MQNASPTDAGQPAEGQAARRSSDKTSPQSARREGVQAIARAARLMRALSGAPDGMMLAELAGAAELPKSTVHRIVAALSQEELLVTDTAGRIVLGPALVRLGAAGTRAMPTLLRPVLEALQDEVQETVDLAVPDGAGMRFVDQLPGPGRLTTVSAVGARFPLHCTANGKAFLAALPPERTGMLLSARLERFTADTIVSRKALEAELRLAGESGVAFDREEHTEGICAVAAVVRDRGGPVAAISVPVPASRFQSREALYAAAVRSAALNASERLSGER